MNEAEKDIRKKIRSFVEKLQKVKPGFPLSIEEQMYLDNLEYPSPIAACDDTKNRKKIVGKK